MPLANRGRQLDLMKFSKPQADAIVVGAGIGGLSAAIRLALQGRSVRLFEKNNHPGGKCDHLQRDGFHFDLGPSVLTLPFLIDELFSEAGKDRRDYLEIEPVEPGCSYFFPDGSRFDAPGTMDDFEAAVADSFPGEIEGFRRFRAYVQRLWEVSGPAYLFHSPGLKALGAIPWLKALRALPDLIPGRMHNRLRRYFKDPRLIQLFARFATYNGSDPYRTPATFNVVAHAELAFGSWRCRGGMFALPRALDQLAKECGVDCRYGTAVKQVAFKGNQITGVETEDGTFHPSKSVICNQDAITARTGELLAAHPRAGRWEKRARSMEASSSGFVLLAALSRRHPELACHNVFFSADYPSEFDGLFRKARPLEDPTIYISRPAGAEPTLAPEGKEGWFVLVNAPSLQEFSSWDQSAYSEKLLSLLQQRCGLTSDEVEWTHSHGPEFYRDSYGAWHGSLYGTSSNPMRQAFLRMANGPKDSNGLFFSGGSAHPGGGIPLVLLSGKLSAESCLSFLGK